MYISDFVGILVLICVCHAQHSIGQYGKNGEDETVRLVERLEDLETKQRTDTDKIHQLEAHAHRQTAIQKEQSNKIAKLEEFVSKQRAALGHALRIARSTRRRMSLIEGILGNKNVANKKALSVHHGKSHSEVKSKLTSPSSEKDTKDPSTLKAGTGHGGRGMHGGKQDRLNFARQSQSQTHSHHSVTSHNHQLQDLGNTTSRKAGHIKNSDRLGSHGSKGHQHSHHREHQSHTSKGGHSRFPDNNKHRQDKSPSSIGNDKHVKNPGTHRNAHNGHHSSQRTENNKHDTHRKHQHNHSGHHSSQRTETDKHDTHRKQQNNHNGHHSSQRTETNKHDTHRKHKNNHNGHHSSSDMHYTNEKTFNGTRHVPKTKRNSRTTRQFGGIAFSVYLDHDATLTQHETVKFNKIITNDGSGYNSQTGVFTCDEGGVYMFTFFIGQRNKDHYMWAELMVNSRNVIDAVVDTYHDYQDLQGGNTVIMRLHQGDRVWIDATHAGSHVEGSATLKLTTFSGLYLYA